MHFLEKSDSLRPHLLTFLAGNLFPIFGFTVLYFLKHINTRVTSWITCSIQEFWLDKVWTYPTDQCQHKWMAWITSIKQCLPSDLVNGLSRWLQEERSSHPFRALNMWRPPWSHWEVEVFHRKGLKKVLQSPFVFSFFRYFRE